MDLVVTRGKGTVSAPLVSRPSCSWPRVNAARYRFSVISARARAHIMHTRTRTRARARTCSHAHAHARTCSHARTHADDTHARTHAHTTHTGHNQWRARHAHAGPSCAPSTVNFTIYSKVNRFYVLRQLLIYKFTVKLTFSVN